MQHGERFNCNFKTFNNNHSPRTLEIHPFIKIFGIITTLRCLSAPGHLRGVAAHVVPPVSAPGGAPRAVAHTLHPAADQREPVAVHHRVHRPTKQIFFTRSQIFLRLLEAGVGDLHDPCCARVLVCVPAVEEGV